METPLATRCVRATLPTISRETDVYPYQVIPHVSAEDDMWEGYCIPKGSFVFANVGYGPVTHQIGCPLTYSQVYVTGRTDLGKPGIILS